jgi:hypothetical protein
MALTTANVVLEMGSLDRPELFGFRSTEKVKLTELANRWIAVNDLHIQQKAAAFYTSTDPLVLDNLAMGEVFLTLADLIGQLAARKVFGTHDSIDSEDSTAYLTGLEEFYRNRAMEFLSDYFTIDEPGSAVALPVFLVSTDVDETLTQSTPDDIDVWLDEARGFPIREVPAIR